MKRKSVFLVILFLFTNLFHISCEDPNEEYNHGYPNPYSLLQKAVMADDLKEVERLLTEEGWKEFIASVRDISVRRDPKNQKVNVNLKGWDETTSLFHVKSLKMAQLLISKGADVLAEDRYKNTPLHEAKTPSIAKLFIEKGADRHAKNTDGRIPYEEATLYNRTEVAEFLKCVNMTQPEDLSDCLK